MSLTREIIVRPEPGDDIRPEFTRFLSLAKEREWRRLRILFGFAWGSYAYENNWIEEVMSPSELEKRVGELEKNGDGAIGADDLFITVEETGTQFTFCHENDIHIQGSPEDPTLNFELERYRKSGWEIQERLKEQANESS